MRLTMRTNLAMRVLMHCGVNAGRIVRKHEIADACNASENHLAQVINTLGQMGLIETQRGRAGGIRIARPLTELRVGAVFRAFEMGVPFAECFDPMANSCPLSACCRLREALAAAVEAFYASLDAITLEDLVRGNSGLDHLLRLSDARPVPICVPA